MKKRKQINRIEYIIEIIKRKQFNQHKQIKHYNVKLQNNLNIAPLLFDLSKSLTQSILSVINFENSINMINTEIIINVEI